MKIVAFSVVFFLAMAVMAVADVASNSDLEITDGERLLGRRKQRRSRRRRKNRGPLDQTKSDRRCSAHSSCSRLTGLCCPTLDNKYLDCCDNSPLKDTSVDSHCSAHSKCAHLSGQCCPTKDKKYLDCCESPAPPEGKDHKGDCYGAFKTVQLWETRILEPDGTVVKELKRASTDPGQTWSFTDYVLDDKGKKKVGFSVELHTRVDKGETWTSEGTIIDLYHCSGFLAFSGTFSDYARSGKYVITGGTGDFLGATGYIIEDFDNYNKLYGYRTIVIE